MKGARILDGIRAYSGRNTVARGNQRRAPYLRQLTGQSLDSRVRESYESNRVDPGKLWVVRPSGHHDIYPVIEVILDPVFKFLRSTYFGLS